MSFSTPVATKPAMKAPLAPSSVSIDRSVGRPVNVGDQLAPECAVGAAAAEPQLGRLGRGGLEAVADQVAEPFQHRERHVLGLVLEAQSEAHPACVRVQERGTLTGRRQIGEEDDAARSRLRLRGQGAPSSAGSESPSKRIIQLITSVPARVG